MKKRMFIMLGCVLLLIAGLALGKYLSIMKMIASMPKPGAQTVTALKVQMQEWQPQLSAVGSLVPVRGVDVTSEIAGQVRDVRFKSGQEVKQGDVLITLNDAADRAQLQALQASADLAASVLERDLKQFAVHAVSQAQVDTDKADLKAKRANVAQQAAQVAKKTIRAPFSGRLGITTVNPGQYVNPGDKLVTLQTINPIYVTFNVPQKSLAQVRLGQTVNLRSDAYKDAAFSGKITAINPIVDSATRNVQIQAQVANPKAQLLPGMFANVDVEAGSKQRYLTLPQAAITYNPYGSTVFVLKAGDKKDENGKTELVAQQTIVTTGDTRGDQVAVLTGITEGQQVVTSGQLKLKNGTPVVIDNKTAPANDPSPTPQEK